MGTPQIQKSVLPFFSQMLKDNTDLFIKVTFHAHQFAQDLNILLWAQANLTTKVMEEASGPHHQDYQKHEKIIWSILYLPRSIRSFISIRFCVQSRPPLGINQHRSSPSCHTTAIFGAESSISSQNTGKKGYFQ